MFSVVHVRVCLPVSLLPLSLARTRARARSMWAYTRAHTPTHTGATLDNEQTLAQSSITDGATLHLVLDKRSAHLVGRR